MFGNILQIFGNFRKMVKNIVIVNLVGLYNKQNITWLLGGMKFIFEDKFHISVQPCNILYVVSKVK